MDKSFFYHTAESERKPNSQVKKQMGRLQEHSQEEIALVCGLKRGKRIKKRKEKDKITVVFAYW